MYVIVISDAGEARMIYQTPNLLHVQISYFVLEKLVFFVIGIRGQSYVLTSIRVANRRSETKKAN